MPGNQWWVSSFRPYIEILVSSEPLTTAQRGRICDSVEGAESLTLIFKLDKNVKSYFLLFFKKKLKIRIPFCGPLIPLSWTFGDVCPGLQSRSRSLTCTLHLLYAMDSLDSPLLWHLLTSWWPSYFQSMYLHVYKHWWGSRLGSSMPLLHIMWQDILDTHWAMPTALK